MYRVYVVLKTAEKKLRRFNSVVCVMPCVAISMGRVWAINSTVPPPYQQERQCRGKVSRFFRMLESFKLGGLETAQLMEPNFSTDQLHRILHCSNNLLAVPAAQIRREE